MRTCKAALSLLLLALAATSCWGAKPQDNPFSIAKALLLQGKRKEAVVMMRGAATGQTRSRAAQGDLESKRLIFAEQFITSENFQKYQDIKAYADAELWSECLRHTIQISPPDADNLLVLRLKALCQMKSGLSEEASKTMFEILQLDPVDPSTLINLAQLALERKQYSEGLKVIEPLAKMSLGHSADPERLAIVKSRLLEESDNLEDAVRTLLADQEAHLNHIEVIYRLAQLYQRHPGYDWQARRAYSLFVSRCKRLPSADLSRLHLEGMLSEAQGNLSTLDKKLTVDASKS